MMGIVGKSLRNSLMVKDGSVCDANGWCVAHLNHRPKKEYLHIEVYLIVRSS